MSIEKVLIDTDLENDLDINEITSINRESLSDEFINQASKYAWYASLLAHARAKREKAKLVLDTKEAELSSRVRQEMVKQGVKVTEGAINETVIGLQDYTNIYMRWIEAKEDEDVIDGVVRALAQRKDMLVAYGSLLKFEVNTEIGIMENNYKRK